MTEQNKNQLLTDILGDEELTQVRQASLLGGLKAMRRRRQRAVAARISMMVLPVLVLAVAVFYPRIQPRYPAPVAAPVALSLGSESASKVEYINTEQLFALFPHRPMALVGKPGHQQVVFLDRHRVGGQ
jgi:hypothetical protein